jgi:hypothetical protein
MLADAFAITLSDADITPFSAPCFSFSPLPTDAADAFFTIASLVYAHAHFRAIMPPRHADASAIFDELFRRCFVLIILIERRYQPPRHYAFHHLSEPPPYH